MIDSITARVDLLGILVMNHGFLVEKQRKELTNTISKIKATENKEKPSDELSDG